MRSAAWVSLSRFKPLMLAICGATTLAVPALGAPQSGDPASVDRPSDATGSGNGSPTGASPSADAPAGLCEEDRSPHSAPTISSRFDPREAGTAGSTFLVARARALSYCRTQSCTIDGRSVPRTAVIDGLGTIRGKFIAGFTCLPAMDVPTGQLPADMTYRFDQPGEIDAAAAKARGTCAAAHVKAELRDLRQTDSGFVAVFACGS
jgi:hypothetical protein